MARFCSNCGEKIENNRAKFCAGCGSPLDITNNNGNSGGFFDDATNSAGNYTLEDAARAGNIDAINELATTYFQQMNYAEARQWAKMGAGVNDAWCMHLMGYMAQHEGNWNEAIRWYERNVRINSYYVSASNLGAIYANFDENPAQPTNHAAAVHFFELAINMDNVGDLAEHYVCLAMCYLIFDDIDKSNIDINKIKNLLQAGYNIAVEIQDESSKKIAQDWLMQIQQLEQESANNNYTNNNDGCFITTAVCDSFNKPDNCYELTMFRDFRDNWLMKEADGKTLVNEYYEIAPRIVERINLSENAKNVYLDIWTDYLKPCLSDLECGDNVSCKNRYTQMVADLKHKYLI
ncbi:MAG: zinc-ribbon domain-containing protein [Selenomonadaceae bacterium]|nr:zinc-ribbon domain-containing protein [Selenomonadaceae bacterium]